MYVVRVHTGDEWGAGTDANIFLNLYGENGDTGERELKDSSTHTNKFERNHVSFSSYTYTCCFYQQVVQSNTR